MTDATGAAVILHAHLFKNAGTTLDWSLGRCFGEAFCDHRDDAAMRGRPDYLRQYLAGAPHISALSSHWLPLPPPALADGRTALVLALLRHPLDRIASVYAFERRQAVDHPGTRRARQGNLRDYVAWRLDAHVGPVIRNYQTRMLSGVYPGEGTEAQLERALENLEHFAGLGCVERFDESAVLFEHVLSPHFPQIDLAYLPQNVTEGRGESTLSERLRMLEDELGDLFEPVCEANRLDLTLYDQVSRQLDSRLQGLPGRERRVSDFRARCARLKD